MQQQSQLQAQKFKCYSMLNFKTQLHPKDLQLVRQRNMNNFFEVRPVPQDEEIAKGKAYAFVQRFQSWKSNEEDLADDNTNEEVCAENIDLLLSELAAYRDAQDTITRIEQDKHRNEKNFQVENDTKWKQLLMEKDTEIASLKETIASMQKNQLWINTPAENKAE